MPLNVMQLGAALDSAYEERGLAAHIDPDKGLIVEGEVIGQPAASPLPARQAAADAPPLDLERASWDVAMADGTSREFAEPLDWLAFLKKGFGALEGDKLEAFMNRQNDVVATMRDLYPKIATSCETAFNDRLRELSP